jgi:ABC-2 type transport system permease protein
VRAEEVRQRGARYIDWLIPGLVGFNLLSTSLWAIGFYIVQMRQNRQLKRLVATPMRRGDFLLSQMLARMVFVAIEIPSS